MTSDLRLPPTRAEISRELSQSFTVITDALQLDRDELERDVLVWQRWLRYAAIVATVGLMLALNPLRLDQAVWVPLVAAGGIYILFTGVVAFYLTRVARKEVPRWVPGSVLAGDVAVLTALVYLSAPPAQFHRMLLLGFLVMQLFAFYFGRRLGFGAMGAVVVAYVVFSLAVPAYVPGTRPLIPVVAVNGALFLFVSGVLVLTFGSFRERMNKFRILCKRAEMGDLGGSYDLATDRFPDDLTLVGRSFNEMRGRLIELIGSDPLTGCVNRRALEQRLGREWRQTKRRGGAATVGVVVVDIDHFKQINDTRGHAAGDYVLQEIGDIMRITARDTDTVARIGGDEFVVVLPDTAHAGATIFAERLRRNVAEHRFVSDGRAIAVTISVGVFVASATDELTMDELLENADREMYKAKSDGRNRISA